MSEKEKIKSVEPERTFQDWKDESRSESQRDWLGSRNWIDNSTSQNQRCESWISNPEQLPLRSVPEGLIPVLRTKGIDYNSDR
ncbi:hypothetical protein GDO78_016310 [Eleutherodactylus coqui]|uniref:Uncharacterized protein n=1 Tax=Eleutherodactylus coqui TaxID=57060 RepID=A0A8J6BK47_ELECQ|nr:hypothetical protein GDO78_016310 [Eleutherodactylus coqui]